MSNITKNMDSVYSSYMNDELEFDTIFDQDDSLIDTVNGVNEAGEPLTGVDFEELHQTDDNATPDDIRDELGEGHDTKDGSPDPEGAEKNEQTDNSVKGEIGKDSDADKFYGDAEGEYQDNNDGPKPDENSVTDTIDKVVENEEPSEDIDNLLDPEEGEESVAEAAKGADSDVKDAVDDENDPENKDIDDILDSDEEGESSVNLDYNLSDEDLIDMAISGDSE